MPDDFLQHTLRIINLLFLAWQFVYFVRIKKISLCYILFNIFPSVLNVNIPLLQKILGKFLEKIHSILRSAVKFQLLRDCSCIDYT